MQTAIEAAKATVVAMTEFIDESRRTTTDTRLSTMAQKFRARAARPTQRQLLFTGQQKTNTLN